MQDVYLLVFAIFGAGVALLVSMRIHYHERSGESLRSALSTLGDAIIATGRQGLIVSFNPVAEKLTGWTAREVKGKPAAGIIRLLNHDTRAPMEDMAEKVLVARETAVFIRNAVLVSRTGAELPVDGSAAPITDRKGRVTGAVIIFRDISERYAAEQRLLESEERLKAITDTARIGLVMIDRERRYVYANQFYRQMVGIGDAAILGKQVADVLPALYERIRPNLERAFAGERVSYQIKGAQKGDRLYSVTYEPQARQSLIMHVVIVVLDITDVKAPA